MVVKRNCIRRPTLLASPTTKTNQPPLQKMRARHPPLQKCVRGRLGERPPAQQPPLREKACPSASPKKSVTADGPWSWLPPLQKSVPVRAAVYGLPPLPYRLELGRVCIWLPLKRISGSGRGALPLPLNFASPK